MKSKPSHPCSPSLPQEQVPLAMAYNQGYQWIQKQLTVSDLSQWLNPNEQKRTEEVKELKRIQSIKNYPAIQSQPNDAAKAVDTL